MTSPSAAPNAARCASTSDLAKFGEIARRVRPEGELVGVRPPVVPHGERLAAPDERRAAHAEVLPSTPRQFGGPPLRRPVPAFHRQNAEAIAGREPATRAGTGERRAAVGLHVLIERDDDAELGKLAWNCSAVLSDAMRGKDTASRPFVRDPGGRGGGRGALARVRGRRPARRAARRLREEGPGRNQAVECPRVSPLRGWRRHAETSRLEKSLAASRIASHCAAPCRLAETGVR